MFGAYTIPVIVAILGILLIVFRGPTAGIVLPLIIGIVAGLFSSVCLSGPLWVLLDGVFGRKKDKDGKKAGKRLSSAE